MAVRKCNELKKENVISEIDLLAITGDISMQEKGGEMKAIKKELEEKLMRKL